MDSNVVISKVWASAKAFLGVHRLKQLLIQDSSYSRSVSLEEFVFWPKCHYLKWALLPVFYVWPKSFWVGAQIITEGILQVSHALLGSLCSCLLNVLNRFKSPRWMRVFCFLLLRCLSSKIFQVCVCLTNGRRLGTWCCTVSIMSSFM